MHMNFGHIGFSVKDVKRNQKFYAGALAPLGLSVLSKGDGYFSVGNKKRDTNLLWISKGRTATSPFHIAFEAKDKKQVNAFYKAALKAGGKDNGAPGIRKDYSPTYYAAFVIDPNGHNIEAVCRK